MFCSKCGTKLDDDAKFCPQCGNKIARSSGSAIPNTDSIDSAVDLQKVKANASSAIAGLKNLEAGKKYLYGVIISAVLIILFGSMTASALNPAKKVKAEITYASEPYTENSSGTFYRDTYYQRLDVEYKDKEWSGIYEIGFYNPHATLDTSYHAGASITAYIVDGELVLDKDDAEVSIIGVIFSIILLLGSIGSCGWFGLQYFNYKKRG